MNPEINEKIQALFEAVGFIKPMMMPEPLLPIYSVGKVPFHLFEHTVATPNTILETQKEKTSPVRGHESGLFVQPPPTPVRAIQTQSVEVQTMPLPENGHHTNGYSSERGNAARNGNSTDGEADSVSESDVDEAEPSNPVVKTILAFCDGDMTTYQRLKNYEFCGTNLDVDVKAIPSVGASYKREDAFWNVVYPGCYSSQAEHHGSRYGFFEINPRTIRPFEVIHSRQSMVSTLVRFNFNGNVIPLFFRMILCKYLLVVVVLICEV